MISDHMIARPDSTQLNWPAVGDHSAPRQLSQVGSGTDHGLNHTLITFDLRIAENLLLLIRRKILHVGFQNRLRPH